MFGFLKRYFFILSFILLYVPLHLSAANNDGSRYAPNSVLSIGDWYKIKIPSTGVYKLTYNDLKNKIGLSNPANVKIYGYGGWVLDENFSNPYVDDLPEVSIWMSSKPENFGKDDYILFYARGDIKWEYNETTKEFEQTQNTYSKDTYYFVTESTDAPLIMDTQPSLPASTNVVTTFNDYVLHQEESKNLGETGRMFFGENFSSNLSQPFTLTTDGVTTDPAIIRYSFVSYIIFPNGQYLDVKLNNSRNKNTFLDAISGESKTITYATLKEDTIVTNALKSSNILDITYSKKYTSDKNLYLNYIRINYNRILKSYGGVTLFRSTNTIGDLTYQISNAKNSMLVFDVTDNYIVKKIDTQLEGSVMSFTASNSSIREYALVDLSQSILTPTLVDKNDSHMGKVSNQNLHALSGFDMVIIVPPFLQTYANKIAEIHQKEPGFKSLVVNPDDIYNEFSSGKPDVTAYRRFMKMFYDRANGGVNRPQYLLLFGGGTYDNRLTEGAWTSAEKKSMLLTYQTEESLLETTSYVTDDYIGFLDDTSGKDLGKDSLNVSVGRLPVRGTDEASAIVSKIESYYNNNNKGIWQNDILYVADDLLGSAANQNDTAFINGAERLANYTNLHYPNFITNKIYEDAYERVIQANGARYPAATEALLDKIDRGVLVLNFVGHGSTTSWTHENLLTYSDIEDLKNENLGLWITATCDFSRYDGGSNSKTGGELALSKKVGGAVALFSTVRPAYTNKNSTMNKQITKYLLERDSDGKPLRVGDIMRKAKYEMVGDDNKLKFALIGDPAMRLAFPSNTYAAEVTQMNGKNSDEDGINIEALSNNIIIGHIVDLNGDVATNFNGTLESVIFDSEQNLKTKGNTSKGTNSDKATDYKAYTNTLFSGKVKVENGTFRIEFVTPKDILYTNAKGKMSFFAYDNDGNEAQGSFLNYTVGGTNTDLPEESDGPTIEEIYLNNDNFKSGDRVNPTPLFYAKISDDTGINLSSAPGHNIALIIDGTTEYNLTPYFENEDNSSKKGSVTFRIPELTLGNHSLKLRVWDVLNNSTVTDPPIDFIVTNDIELSTYSFEIWGNPAKEMTKFVFSTETPNENVDIKLSVYSLTGQMVWTYNGSGTADTLSRYIYDWDLYGYGGRLIPGVYICNAQITINGKTSSVKSQKLVVTSN